MGEKIETTTAACPHPGMAATTDIRIRKLETGYEARVGFALFGSPNMTEAQYEACNYDPFHPEFHDNYCCGVGSTPEEAKANLKKDWESVYATIWY